MMAEYYAGIAAERVESFLFLEGKERYLKLLKAEPHP